MIRTSAAIPSINPHPSVIRTAQNLQHQNVSLPHLFTPRHYQEEDLFRPLFPHHYSDLTLEGVQRKKRIVDIWHRRAGKDLGSFSALVLEAYEHPANYLHLFPEQTQAKKVIWRGIDNDGIRFKDRCPDALIKKTYESEMLIELVNGSTIQIGGSDVYNSWMGTNPQGIVFSEYSLQDPLAWQYFRPILRENGGWAVFIYTARGKNHGYDLLQVAKRNPKTWHLSIRTIDDTHKEDGTPVVSREEYEQEIEEGMPDELARQEFYCDFTAALVGAFYGEIMERLRGKERIGFFPHDPVKPVFTFWDIGLDCNAVVFAQATDGGDPRIIDYIEEEDEKFSAMCKRVLEKPYTYRSHFGPHDITRRDPEKNTRVDTAEKLGIIFEEPSPKVPPDEWIEQSRQVLPRCQFDEEETHRLVDALTSFERPYDEKLRTFKTGYLHNWASHGASAFGILAQNWGPEMLDDTWLNDDLALDDSHID